MLKSDQADLKLEACELKSFQLSGLCLSPPKGHPLQPPFRFAPGHRSRRRHLRAARFVRFWPLQSAILLLPSTHPACGRRSDVPTFSLASNTQYKLRRVRHLLYKPHTPRRRSSAARSPSPASPACRRSGDTAPPNPARLRASAAGPSHSHKTSAPAAASHRKSRGRSRPGARRRAPQKGRDGQVSQDKDQTSRPDPFSRLSSKLRCGTSELRDLLSDLCSLTSVLWSLIKNGLGSLIMLPRSRPTSAQAPARCACCSTVIYPQSRAKSIEASVSLFSPSQSVSLLTK